MAALTPFRQSERRLLLLVADLLAAIIAVALALWTWSITSGFDFNASFIEERATWFVAVPIWVIALSYARHPHYALDSRATRAAIARGAAAILIAYLAVFFASGSAVLPRLMAMYFIWNAALLSFAARLIAGWIIARQGRSRRVLIVGEGSAIDSALEILKRPSFADIQIAGVVGAHAHAQSIPLTTGSDLFGVAARLEATDLVVAAAGDVDPAIAEGALLCQVQGMEVAALSDLYEHAFRRVPVQHLGPTWVLTNLVGTAHLAEPPLAKRLLDLAAGVTVGAFTLVVLPFVAAAIVVDSGRPVFYRQVRLGRGGREFWITKFRTMRQDAERSGPQWSPVGDSRTTRVGRVLRRTRIDELPNIWSVIRGEMSMVGPRPERPAFVEMLDKAVPLYRARLATRPGLTGWAQVNHTYTDSVDDAVVKLEYDLYYVKHQSLAFDIGILARTVRTMFSLKGR
ncbi:MAG: sugar transferase [Acidobacteriota bacterium]|nr:sugar transferase [Acidobacteriota bacterium]